MSKKVIEKKQFAVLGLGNFGFSLAQNLESFGCEVIAVDSSEERIQEIADDVSYAMRAELNDPDLIQMLGARNLDGVVVAISENLEISILATMMAKELGAPFVLAKARSERHGKILKKLGADAVVFPERDMGSRVAKSIVATNFADWIELSPDFSMVETTVPRQWVGQNLRNLAIREQYGINVVGVIRNKQVTVNMDPDEEFQDMDMLIVIGENEMLKQFSEEKDS